jgi:hypothetical protein
MLPSPRGRYRERLFAKIISIGCDDANAHRAGAGGLPSCHSAAVRCTKSRVLFGIGFVHQIVENGSLDAQL